MDLTDARVAELRRIGLNAGTYTGRTKNKPRRSGVCVSADTGYATCCFLRRATQPMMPSPAASMA